MKTGLAMYVFLDVSCELFAFSPLCHPLRIDLELSRPLARQISYACAQSVGCLIIKQKPKFIPPASDRLGICRRILLCFFTYLRIYYPLLSNIQIKQVKYFRDNYL